MAVFFPATILGNQTISLVLSSNTSNYNLKTAAGNPSGPVTVVLTINSGVKVYSTLVTTPAVDLSGFALGSSITVINNGNIYGMGGYGGSIGYNAAQDGGDAIKLGTNNVTIDNTNGTIFGGGGGGGAGGEHQGFDGKGFYVDGGGGGGGGGQSYTTTIGSLPDFYEQSSNGGGSGTVAGPGAGGAGGDNYGAIAPERGGAGGTGGTWGAAGNDGDSATSGSMGVYAGFPGGAGGYAVRLNGKTVTWLGGNNGTQVKGSVA